MSRSDLIEVEGIVSDNFPGSKFEVTVNQEKGSAELKVICTLSGKLRKNNIRVVRGDKVTIRVSPYDLTKGIICWRA